MSWWGKNRKKIKRLTLGMATGGLSELNYGYKSLKNQQNKQVEAYQTAINQQAESQMKMANDATQAQAMALADAKQKADIKATLEQEQATDLARSAETLDVVYGGETPMLRKKASGTAKLKFNTV